MAGMSAASNYLENEVLDHVLGTGAYTMPSQCYLALYSSNPNEDNSGSELSGSGYARQAVDFDAASGGTAALSADATFTASGGSWLEATHFAIFDASTAGNMLIYGALASSRTAADGDSIVFAAGALTVSLA